MIVIRVDKENTKCADCGKIIEIGKLAHKEDLTVLCWACGRDELAEQAQDRELWHNNE